MTGIRRSATWIRTGRGSSEGRTREQGHILTPAIIACLFTAAALAIIAPPVEAIDDLRSPEYDLLFGAAQKARSATPDIPVALEGPIDPRTYRMVPGDLLLLEAGGEADRSWRLAVTAEGDLLIPNGKPVRAAGNTLETVAAMVRDALARRFPDTPIGLHLVQLGAYRIVVTGQIGNPGITVLHAYDRLSNAITLCGGPLPGASLRKIVVTASDGTRRECDLVRFAVMGEIGENPQIPPGTAIQVQPAREYVRVTGAIRGLPGPDRGLTPNATSRIPENPNILLEWKDGDTAAFALLRAGGLSEDASGEILLTRGAERRMIPAADAGSIALQPGDVLEAAMRERWVYVNGAIRFPGPYPHLPSLLAADYVRIAGGPTEIGRGNGWSIRMPDSNEKIAIGKESHVPPGATIWVPERWTYKTSTLLAPLSGITALVISLVALTK
jgi:protein involved in polysaccharide export with SLBB domain